MIARRIAALPFRFTLALAASMLPLWGSAALADVPINPDQPTSRVESDQVFERLDFERPPALGPEPAKVVVVVFSDFQCPVCRRSAAATRQIAHEFPGEVRLEFWQDALAMHKNAENAAVASLAAQRQGKFWDYHDVVFENQRALDAPSLAGHAEQLGLDMEKFRRDYDDPVLRARVKDETAFAHSLGATATPAFLINGKLYLGWGSWQSFRGNVEREVMEARKLESSGTPVAQIAELRATAQVTDVEKLRAYVDRVLPAPKPAAAAEEKSEGKTKKDKKARKQKKQKAPAEK